MALVIGCVSTYLLWVTLNAAYYEYWVYPREKGPDYIYPQLRYTVFDLLQVLWCVVGVIASALSFRTAISDRDSSGWVRRTILLYLALLAVLLLVGTIMLFARNYGH